MTKEEIIKEAEEYIKVNNLEWELECHRTSPIGEIEQAYITGATEATKKFESCLEDTIKGKNPFPNICWELICDANNKLIEQKTKLEKENAELEQFTKTQGRKLRQQSKECDKAINRVEILAKENTALKQDWEIMQSTISEANDWNDKLVLENKILKEENAKLKKAISDLGEKWQRFEELSKEMR